MDSTLKPLLKHIPSFIKDTRDFLNIFKQHTHLHEDEIMVTIDVSALYTSIPYDEGIEAVKKALTAHPSTIMDSETASILLAIILKNNTFKFNNNIYLQIQGTAMGTKVAPTYANIFMDDLERNILEHSEIRPVIWRCFIDDIFAIYRCTEDELIEHLTYLNQQHHSIKFTYEFSRDTINFLDTTVYLDTERKLHTKVFRKPTDMYSYLHYESYHPPHQKNSIAYSQAIRLRTICSEISEFEKASQTLLKFLTLQGHPHHKVKDSIHKAKNLNRQELLKPRTRDSKPIIPFILQHNPHHHYAHNIIREAKLLFTGKIENTKFYKNKIIIANNGAPNLGDILTASTFPKPPPKRGSRPCMRLSCNPCENIICTNKITSSNTKNVYQILGDNTCLTKNTVYVIHCLVYLHQYVGETGHTVNERISEHKRDIRYRRKTSPVAKHFIDHNVLETDLLCTIIYSTPKDQNIRLRLEEAWIRVLNTMTPSGINHKLWRCVSRDRTTTNTSWSCYVTITPPTHLLTSPPPNRDWNITVTLMLRLPNQRKTTTNGTSQHVIQTHHSAAMPPVWEVVYVTNWSHQTSK